MTKETPQKKVVGRTVAVVLGIICIILSAGLVGSFALYLPAANSVSQLNSEIATKNSLIASQNATIFSQSQQITALQKSLSQTSNSSEQIDTLNAYISDLMNILYLNVSTTFFQNPTVQVPPNSSLTVFDGTVPYAGYITVQVQADSNTTYLQVAYSHFPVLYDETIVVGASGTGHFPVLPTSQIEIKLGNTETSDSVNATVTATYYY